MSFENDVRDLCFDNAGLRAKLELAEAALEVERWGRYESPVSQDEGLRNIRANWDSMVRDNQALRAKLAEAEGWRASHRCDVPPGERLSWHGRVMGEKDAELAEAVRLLERYSAPRGEGPCRCAVCVDTRAFLARKGGT